MFSKSSLNLALGIAATSSLVSAGPCDIYGNCIAAHATTRALYNAYNGPLYQVKRGSDGAGKGIHSAERVSGFPSPPLRSGRE